MKIIYYLMLFVSQGTIFLEAMHQEHNTCCWLWARERAVSLCLENACYFCSLFLGSLMYLLIGTVSLQMKTKESFPYEQPTSPETHRKFCYIKSNAENP